PHAGLVPQDGAPFERAQRLPVRGRPTWAIDGASMASRTIRAQALGLAGWLVLAFIAAGVGAVASASAPSFYGELARPDWAPPSSVFGPVWPVLYALMGIAAWVVWRDGSTPASRPALMLFVAQLALNALWSWLFFAWHRGGLAFLDIVVLWVLIVLTI